MIEMLKRYHADDRVQWVGKAWEIRRALRQELKKSGGKARLSELLIGTGKSAGSCLTAQVPPGRGRSAK